MRPLLPSILCIVLLSASLAAHGQSSDPYRVRLSISAEDLIESQARSVLSKELRSFGDVEISYTDNAQFDMSVIILKAAGIYAGTVVVTEPLEEADLKNAFYREVFKTYNPDENRIEFAEGVDTTRANQLIKIYTHDAVYERYYGLLTDTDLEALCKRMIADVDVNVFEERRKFLDMIRNN